MTYKKFGFLTAIMALSGFYLYTLYLAAHPNVSLAYKLYYLEGKTRFWEHNSSMTYQPGNELNGKNMKIALSSIRNFDTGGIIGVGYWDAAVCDTDPRSIARAMKHIRDLVGIQHVALGSDYDGATTVRFDTSQLAHLTQALLDEGFTPDEIRAAMGGNALRVLRAGIVPLPAGTRSEEAQIAS